MSEARLEDGVPVTAGWFVVNARDTWWLHNDRTPHTIVNTGSEPAVILVVG